RVGEVGGEEAEVLRPGRHVLRRDEDAVELELAERRDVLERELAAEEPRHVVEPPARHGDVEVAVDPGQAVEVDHVLRERRAALDLAAAHDALGVVERLLALVAALAEEAVEVDEARALL